MINLVMKNILLNLRAVYIPSFFNSLDKTDLKAFRTNIDIRGDSENPLKNRRWKPKKHSDGYRDVFFVIRTLLSIKNKR